MDLSNIVTDQYSRRARLYPCLYFILPLYIIAYIFMPEHEGTISKIVTLILACGGAMFAMQITRDLGKKAETKLFTRWGGKPTTFLLRHSDQTLTNAEKSKYVSDICKVYKTIDASSDIEISNAVSWLIGQTRERQKFYLLLEENINYGFRRNLYGLKPLIQLIDIGLMAVLIYFAITRANISIQIAISLGIAFIHLSLTTFIITDKWVKTAALNYAERLFKCCEEL